MTIFSLSLQFKNNLNNRISKDETTALLSNHAVTGHEGGFVFAGEALMSTPVREGRRFLRSFVMTLRRTAEWWLSSQPSGWLRAEGLTLTEKQSPWVNPRDPGFAPFDCLSYKVTLFLPHSFTPSAKKRGIKSDIN